MLAFKGILMGSCSYTFADHWLPMISPPGACWTVREFCAWSLRARRKWPCKGCVYDDAQNVSHIHIGATLFPCFIAVYSAALASWPTGCGTHLARWWGQVRDWHGGRQACPWEVSRLAFHLASNSRLYSQPSLTLISCIEAKEVLSEGQEELCVLRKAGVASLQGSSASSTPHTLIYLHSAKEVS